MNILVVYSANTAWHYLWRTLAVFNFQASLLKNKHIGNFKYQKYFENCIMSIKYEYLDQLSMDNGYS